MTAHQLFTFIDTLTDSLIGIFCQNVEGLRITQHSDDAGNVAKAAPQHDKQTHPEGKTENLEQHGKVCKQLGNSGFFMLENLQAVRIITKLNGTEQQADNDRNNQVDQESADARDVV